MATTEQLFWTRLNHAVSGFCLEVTQSRLEPESKIVSALVGEELEWCGSHSFLFMASRYLSTVRRIQEAEHKLKVLESSLVTETQNVGQLRKQLKQAQLAAEDNDWQLQEQLAHASNVLHMEKEANAELKSKLATTQAKLVEVEMFLSSENGGFALELEEALAAAKMKIAELEAEKDDLEMQMRSSARRAGAGAGTAPYAQQQLFFDSPGPAPRRSDGEGEGKENQQQQVAGLGFFAGGAPARKVGAPVLPPGSGRGGGNVPPSVGARFSLAGFASLLEE